MYGRSDGSGTKASGWRRSGKTYGSSEAERLQKSSKVFMEIQRVKDIKGNLKDTDRS